jgi:SHS family lactate transporter-like MFS transporter
MTSIPAATPIPWWKEPTKDQWLAWVAAWLGWTLDAFDFTIFLLIMVPIAKEFEVPLTAVTAVFTLTLWMRLVGATASGWLADRIGRKKPMMISIAWYSACNFIAGFSPTFWFLFVFRALLGIGMGAEWPAGAALAMETWPQRSRGFMGAVLQGSWGLGALLSSAAYGLLYDSIGWRGLLWIGVLPALSIVYIRIYVKEPPVWLENRRLQREQNRQVRAPLFSIFKRQVLGNTLTACWMMASAFVVGYSVGGMFPSYLQKDLGLNPGLVALPVMLSSLMFFLSAALWGWYADRFGRRKATIITALLTIPTAPFYLLTTNYTMIVVFFTLQGAFGGGGMHVQYPHYLSERFPTEVRATAAGFCYHQGAIFGGLVGPVLAYFATD